MKKLIILLSLCIVGILIIHRDHQDEKCSLLLENIEALAGNEDPNIYRCMDQGSVDCPSNHTKVKHVIIGEYR